MSLLKVGAPNDISSLRKGRKLTVGSMSDLIIVKKIGEGGSAYIYTARRSGAGGTSSGASSSLTGGGSPTKNGSRSTSSSVVRSLNLFSDSASVSGLGGGGANADNGSVLNDIDDDQHSVMSYAVGDSGNARGGRRRRSRRSLLSRMGSSRGSGSSRRPSLSLHNTSASSAASAAVAAYPTAASNYSDRQNHHHHHQQQQQQQQQQLVVIKATSTSGSARRRRQAEKEIELLLRFRGHPNIVHIYDWASITTTRSKSTAKAGGSGKSLVTLCAMEYCHGGSLMELICKRREVLHTGLFTERDGNNNGRGSGFRRRLKSFTARGGDGDDDGDSPPPPPPLPFASEDCSTNFRAYLDFDDILSIFQQVATAIDFLHNQHVVGSSSSSSPTALKRGRRPKPVTHRDIKPENILLIPTNVSNMDGSMLPGMNRYHVKICDFGSAVEGTVPLHTPEERRTADDTIQTSTTQMYRAPEMIDVHSVEELTEKTDIWSLGCTLYMACFLQNCFEENSNLAILSGNYIDPPGDHPYGKTHLQELIERMLTVDASLRANVQEVTKCINAMIAGKALPKRSAGSKSRSRTAAADSSAVSTPKKTPDTSSSRRGLHASPPPPPPPPRISQNGNNDQGREQRHSDGIPRSVVVDRRSTRAKERSERYESSGPKVSVDANYSNDDLLGTRIMMQSVPENDAIRSKRDLRKKSNTRKPTRDITSASASADHIYSDLGLHQHSGKAKNTAKKAAAKTPNSLNAGLHRATSPDLFAPEDEWKAFGTEQTKEDGMAETLDRIKIYTFEDRSIHRATSPDVSCETPPLTPLEQSSNTSAASSNDFSFSREPPAMKRKEKDPPGRLTASSFYR